jgi:hypothetical protein
LLKKDDFFMFAAGAGGFMINYPHEVCFVYFY